MTDAVEGQVGRSQDDRAGLSGADSLQRCGDVHGERPGIGIPRGHGGEQPHPIRAELTGNVGRMVYPGETIYYYRNK